MPSKKTLEEVKEYIENVSNGKTVVLADEYVNEKEPLKLQCECGNIFFRSYDKIKSRNIFVCNNCAYERRNNLFRLDFSDILQTIKDNNCEYVSGEYHNNKSKLLLRCSCGNLFYKSMVKFKSGQNHCSECGNKNLIKSKTKYDLDTAMEILNFEGYKMIGDYKNSHTPVRCICKNNHECNITLAFLLSPAHSGCYQCGIEKNSGENHYNFNNWNSTIQDNLRSAIQPWKKNIREIYNEICPITKVKGEECVVHHLDSLSYLYYKELKNYNISIPLKDKVSSFEDIDLYFEIKRRIVSKHDALLGVLINKEIHRKFHSLYGVETTRDQFDAFLRDEYSLTLESILKKG